MGVPITMLKLVESGPSHVSGIISPEVGRRVNSGPDFPLVFGGKVTLAANDTMLEVLHNGTQPITKGEKVGFLKRLFGAQGRPDRLEPLIIAGTEPLVIVVRSPKSGATALLLDAGAQGYQALACDGEVSTSKDNLTRFVWEGETEFSVFAYFSYNADFDSERADGDLEVKRGKVQFTYSDGRQVGVDWDNFRQNAFDWFELEVERKDNRGAEIVSLELA